MELRLVCDQHLSDKPSGVVHGLTGDRRRLHSLAEGGEGGASISNFEPVDDDPMLSPAREERVHDEAQRARDLLERVHRPILAALEQAGNLSTEALDGLELVGGGWRVPAVQEEIQSLLAKAGSGKDLPTALSKTLNADEAVRARR